MYVQCKGICKYVHINKDVSIFSSIQICDPVEQIPSAEMEAAREAWSKGPQHVPQPRKREHPM